MSRLNKNVYTVVLKKKNEKLMQVTAATTMTASMATFEQNTLLHYVINYLN